MANYNALSRALKESVEIHTPDILYPKKCTIKKIKDNLLDVIVTIGGDVELFNLEFIGNPIENESALLIPTNNSYTEAIVICKDFTTINESIYNIDEDIINNLMESYKIEIRNQVIKILAEKVDEDYLTPIIDEIQNDLIEYQNLLGEYKDNLITTQELMSGDKELLINAINDKADKEHTHTFEEVYTDNDEI